MNELCLYILVGGSKALLLPECNVALRYIKIVTRAPGVQAWLAASRKPSGPLPRLVFPVWISQSSSLKSGSGNLAKGRLSKRSLMLLGLWLSVWLTDVSPLLLWDLSPHPTPRSLEPLWPGAGTSSYVTGERLSFLHSIFLICNVRDLK